MSKNTLDLYLDNTEIRKEVLGLKIMEYSQTHINFQLNKSLTTVMKRSDMEFCIFVEKMNIAVKRYVGRLLSLDPKRFTCELYDREVIIRAKRRVRFDIKMIEEELKHKDPRGYSIHNYVVKEN